jgi:hypothetical protein
MECDRRAIHVAAADRVNLSVQRDHGDRSARTRERRERAPPIPLRVVLERRILRVEMHVAEKAADDIDLAVQCGRAGMAERPRHRRALAPAIGRRVVFLIERVRILPARHAADHINPAVHGDDGRFRARFAERRLFGPGAAIMRDGR